MTNGSASPKDSLRSRSRRWLEEADALRSVQPEDGDDTEDQITEHLQWMRRGMVVRRAWDRSDPEEELRRQLIYHLTAEQSRFQQKVDRWIQVSDDQTPPETDRFAKTLEALVQQEEQYLHELLEDSSDDDCRAAFAIAAFRDDLQWLSGLISLFEERTRFDLIGRILLEQKVLQQHLHFSSAPSEETSPLYSGASEDASKSVDLEAPELREAVDRLQHQAMILQVDLLEEDLPSREENRLGEASVDAVDESYRRWMIASQLLVRFESVSDEKESRQEDLDRARERVKSTRRRRHEEWKQGFLDLDADIRQDAFQSAIDDLSDRVGETVTFLEELPMREGLKSLRVLEEDLRWLEETFRSMESDLPCRKSCRVWKRTLRSRQRTVAGELQERLISSRLENRFGHGFVSFLERTILCLLILFCIMLVLERPLIDWFDSGAPRPASTTNNAEVGEQEMEKGVSSSKLDAATRKPSDVEAFFAWLDLFICSVFLFDFFLKLFFADRRLLFVRRNWLTGLLPSIPVGFLIYWMSTLPATQVTGGATWIVALRFLRYLRLPRMARWLRIARPVLRGFRLLAFSLRASDRLVRQMAPILNREIILFESLGISQCDSPLRERFQSLREQFYYRASDSYDCLERSSRHWLIRLRCDDLSTMLSAARFVKGIGGGRLRGDSHREIPVEHVIARLLSTNPAMLPERIGLTLAESIARWCRAMDVAFVRRFPLVRDLVSAAKLPDPFETTAYAANRIGVFFQWLLDRVYWFSDLYGIITAPQLVDSIGQYMVKGATKPAKRLVIVGIGLLALSQLAQLFPHRWVTDLAESFERVLGWPVILLGLICFVFLAVGVWLRRIAGEATELYSQVAEAQFIDGTLQYKQRVADRQYALLQERVYLPHLSANNRHAEETDAHHRNTRQKVIDQLWEDYLLGSPLNANDTRTPTQLLGNPILISLRECRLELSKSEKKQLQRLDLENQPFSLRGPYLWFHFITHSLQQQSAKLVLAYNRFLLTASRGEKAERWQVYRHVQWLCDRTGKPYHELRIPSIFLDRYGEILKDFSEEGIPLPKRLSPEELVQRFEHVPDPARLRNWFESDDFNTLHFLLADAEREREVAKQYGNEVMELLRRDRRNNIRRVFSTYPLDRWPKERRTINPLTFYNAHLSGGKVILFPIRLLLWSMAISWKMFRTFLVFVGEVLKPVHVESEIWEDADSIEVARRKIHRMCKPLFMQALSLRAQLDPEYLGVRLDPPSGESAMLPSDVPGEEKNGNGSFPSASSPIEDDLQIIGAPYHLLHRYRQMAGERQSQIMAFRKWKRRLQWRIESPYQLRAMAIAYCIDDRRIRTVLEAADELWSLGRSLADDSRLESPPKNRSLLKRTYRTITLKQHRTKKRAEMLLSHPLFRKLDLTKESEKAFLRSILARSNHYSPLLKTVLDVKAKGKQYEQVSIPLDRALESLLQIGSDPEPSMRQLTVLRTVQTLSVLDLDNYVSLVSELGQYATHEET